MADESRARFRWYAEACWLAFLAGVLWRLYYICCAHPPDNYIYADMKLYFDCALRWLTPHYTAWIMDTSYPPGTSALIVFCYTWDLSGGVAVSVQFLFSVLEPLLVGAIGGELFGRRTALLALAIASLYFPFINYGGFFLAENPFLFFTLLTMWLLVKSLKAHKTLSAFFLGAGAGLALGLAAEFKSVILLPGLLLAACLAWVAWQKRWRGILPVFAGGLLGLCAILAPCAVRATRLNEGRFCLVSTNTGSNFFQGHHGRIFRAIYTDQQRGTCFEMGCPANNQRFRDAQDVNVNYGLYDADALYALAWQWIRDNPWDAVLLSSEHVFDLFVGNAPWPTSDPRLMDLSQQLYLVFIFFPVWLYLWRERKRLLRPHAGGLPEALLYLPMLGLMISVFLTNGEARYRVPFDGFMILLAARWYLRGAETPEMKPQINADERGLL